MNEKKLGSRKQEGSPNRAPPSPQEPENSPGPGRIPILGSYGPGLPQSLERWMVVPMNDQFVTVHDTKDNRVDGRYLNALG